ncbi:MAG TPA: PAS domain S-box protein [Opitutaceae bacterium]
MPAPLPSNEAERLRAVRESGLLDTPPEREFDDLVALAAEICRAPIAVVSLLDEHRQWFKAKVGLDLTETERRHAFCAYTIDSPDLLIVPDATKDPRFAHNPYVTGDPHVRFYAGAPLAAETGETLGSLCVIDRHPRQLSADEQRALRVLANNATNLIRLRRQVTTQKHMEAQLREVTGNLERERERLLEAQSVAKIGSWETDLATFAVTWTIETHRIFETDPARYDPSRRGFREFVHPDDRPEVIAAFEASLKSHKPHRIEHRIVLPDGREKIVEERWQIFFDANGRPVRASGTCQDITDRRAAEAESEALAVKLVDTLESITDAFYTLDCDWRFTFVNREAERLLVRRREELIGKTIWAEFPQTVGSTFEQKYREAVATPSTLSFEAFYPPLRRWFAMRAYPSGQGLAVYFRDVTDRVRIEREAARASRALLMLTRCNETLVRATHEQELLRAVCEIAVEVGGFRMAWVGYALNDAAKTIQPQAHAGAEKGYLDTINLSWDTANPVSSGPAGRCINGGRSIFVADLTDPASGFWFMQEALARGYRSLVCVPLMHDGKTFGLLALYLPEVVIPPAEELHLLEDLAGDLAFGIVTLRERAERRRTHEAVLTMARAISTVIGPEFFPEFTRSLIAATGAHAGVVAQCDPRDPGNLRTLHAIAGGRVLPNFDQSLGSFADDALRKEDIWIIERDAQRRYPQFPILAQWGVDALVGARLSDAEGRAVGLVFAMFQQPLEQAEFITSTLKIFAARAASEISRQATDARLREQAALLDKAQDAILVRDLQHRITYWNSSAERVYGWTKAEAIGRSARELLYKDARIYDEVMARLREHGDWVGEIAQRNKQGAALIVEGRWTLVRDESGTPQAVLAINTDISHRKQLEQQFLRAQRMESIGTLAGGIAHDLNNLLAPIAMGVDLLRRADVLAPRDLTILDNIKRSADRGANLVRQVLSFARGIQGEKVILNVRHAIREVVSIMETTFPKNIIVEIELAHDLPLVSADPTQLQQILVNLCVNARDAMPNGGRLILRAIAVDVDRQYAVMNRASAPGRFVVIEVCDSGMGMTREIIDRIFEPFFTTKEFGKGTGLGLATVMGIVRGHGGFINVYSEPGIGSTFKVYLPAQATVSEAPPPKPAEESPRGAGETILVVDDEAAIRDVTRRTLEEHGYHVLVAEDGAQAIHLYAQQRGKIALVITDMTMPVMDGATLMLAIRRLDPRIRFIAVSGLAANGAALRASANGVSRFLAKPYSAADLLQSVRQALAEPVPPPRHSRPPF